MQVPFLDLGRLHKSQLQLLEKTIKDVLQESLFVGGDRPLLFEKAFAQYAGLAHAVGCGNGTDALELMLEAAGIGAGDEVIVPAISWVSTASAVLRTGAIPVFCDVEEAFYTLDPAKLPSLLTERTKAVLPVHLYGQLADMPALQAFAGEHQLLLFEDAAQAHGAEFEGKKAGSWGTAAAFSFYPTKNLGALGDAGAVLTNDASLAQRVRQLGNHGQLQKHRHALPGRNSRMDSMQAAVLSAKLPLLDNWNRERRELAHSYTKQLKDIRELNLPQEREGALHVYHLYVIRCPRRSELQTFLASQGVETAIHYPLALSSLEIFRQYPGAGKCPVAEKLSTQLLSLPLFPGLRQKEVAFVCQVIKSFFQ